MQARGNGNTWTGRRARNEDTFCVEPHLGLFAVADGMGGYEGGKLASLLVIDTIRDFFERGGYDDADTDPGFASIKDGRSVAACRMEMAIRLAHRQVLHRATGALSEMGSTLAALLIRDGRALVAHVGDSRVYRYRDGAIRQLTRDHSLVSELATAEGAAAGLPSAVEAALTNVITRAISTQSPAEPDIRIEQARPGDRFLLCSDGLTDVLHDDVLSNLLRDHSLDEAPDRMLELAYAAGSQDNITAVTVDVP